MTNLFPLCLVFTTLLAVELCSSTPATTTTTRSTTSSERDVIVKNGQRVVVVEYDREGKSNTRVSISPPWANKGEVEEEEACGHHSTAGEVLCDAFGKCMQKITGVVGQTKEPTAARKAHEVKETVARASRDVEETLAEGAHDAKEIVAHKSKEKVKDGAHELKETAAPWTQNVWTRVKTAARALGSATAEMLRPKKVANVVGLTAVAAAFGTCVWVTFLSNYVLGSVLVRQQFRVVQSKLHSVYFKAISVEILVGLLGHVLSRRQKVLIDMKEMSQGVNLLASFFMIEANKSFVHPLAIKAMFERMKAEKEEGRGRGGGGGGGGGERTSELEVRWKLEKLSERLSMLNTYSSWINVLTLMSLTWHLVYLGHRLSAAC